MPFYVGNVMSKAAECTPRFGELDTSFSNTTFDGVINAMVIQPDGKIVVGGEFNAIVSESVSVTTGGIARLNIDGTRDTSFNAGFTFSGDISVENIALQPDGKIIVCHRSITFRGITVNRFCRLNADGTVDTTFSNPANGAPGVDGNAFSAAVQPDGKILVGGIFITARGVTVNRLARFNSDGTLDTTFNTGTNIGVNSNIFKIIVNNDETIYIFGSFTTVRGASRSRIAKLASNGELDTSFNPGTGFSSSVNDAVIQGNNIICVGQYSNYNGTTVGRTVRITATGARETTWPTNTLVGLLQNVICIAEQYDKKLFIGGTFEAFSTGVTQNNFTRLTYDGARDTSYNNGATVGVSGGTTRVLACAVQDDCKIVIGGDFTSVRGVSQSFIARLM